jgi:FkbM family methyltransferase
MNLSYIFDRYFIKQPRLRRFVTSLVERDRDLDVDVAGAQLHINARREHGYLRASRMLRWNGTLRDELPVLMNLFAILRDGDTFIDVGANTGLFTHSMARLINIYPNFRIVSIEAHPDTFSRLASRQTDRVTFLNLAISDSDSELEFIDGAVSHVFTAIDKKSSYNIPGETRFIQSKRLDNLDLNSDSVVLKIDVEGQETRVLNGASRMLSNGTIRAVYLDGYDDEAIHEMLLDHGFQLYEGRTLLSVDKKTFSLLALKPCRTKR